MNFLPFNPPKVVSTPQVDTGDEIPEELDIFFRDERTFLPEGKDFKDLTKEERKTLRNQFRFSYLKPGIYQGITGVKGSI
jgi:hypothetical protein